MKGDIKYLIRELVDEVLDEMTGTGAVAGYQTPNSFQGPGDASRKKKIAQKSMPGGKVVDENDESLPVVRRDITENVDMTGKKCTKCKKGTYKETSQMDDSDGVLHCTNCNHKISRWQDELREGRGRYYNFRETDMMKTHGKISYGIAQSGKMLSEVEFLLGICERLKTESGTPNDRLWKRTSSDIGKIHGRLKEIARRINRLGK